MAAFVAGGIRSCGAGSNPGVATPVFFSFIVFLPFNFLLFILTANPVSFARFLPKSISSNDCNYYMAESVFAMRLVNLRSVTCYTDQNFQRKCSFRSSKPFFRGKEILSSEMSIFFENFGPYSKLRTAN